ncbi:putative disease resistance protein RGA4 isoform X2 [Vitis riparia]|uniref:putative disease resistance protein RGA4 isoform X2 n=1 Tax=Vitis riparia TaxID=96939 RepID=UPI00155ABF4A|nr:putative disease resistance protein RGA4 isoform X2 [Vitis riparia]
MYDSVSIIISPIASSLMTLIWLLMGLGDIPALEGIKDELEKLWRALVPIKAELMDEEDLQVADPVLEYWLGELQDAASDAQDVLGAFSTKVYWSARRKQQQQVCPGNASLQFNVSFHKIKDIVARIDLISQITQRLRSECVGRPKIPYPRPLHYTSSFAGDVVGREDDKSKILDMLLSHDSDQGEECHFSVIPIIGMGGLGKTTLAQLIFNHPMAVPHFDLRIWVCVTVNFNFPRILENIITSLSHLNCDFGGLSTSMLESRVVQLLSGQRFLIVLDDVWTHNYFEWEPLEKVLRHGERGSRVVVTSRTSKVSDIMGNQGPYRLGLLSDDDCWQLFRRIAFKPSQESNRTWGNLEKIGWKIVAKCRGLPLAVKAMAGLLRGNTDVNKWQNISANDICEVEKHNIFPALKLSYDHLPSHIKQCFAYCSLFPKGYVFRKKDLVELWMAEDFIQSTGQESQEETGSQYFDELLMRSFFQPSDVGSDQYTMHDLISELAQLVSGPRCRQVKDGEQCYLSQKTRHVSLLGKDVEQPVLQIVDKCRQLRTLLFPCGYLKNTGNTLDKMFQTLTCIRALDLSSSPISELPQSIDKLELLRYLDLSKTEISGLPHTLCSLYNLQTLRLSGCLSLVELPKDLANLINLRHLELDERFWYKCTKLPPRMGCLTSLHNLHVFPIGCENGYGIEELKGMKYLTGTLHVSKLENAKKNAAEAKLREKESLEKLVLEWSGDVAAPQDEEAHERVLEDLQPHSNLKELLVFRFLGTRFPLLMKEKALQNLVSLSLNHCTKCKFFSIGHLPHLRRLFLKEMQELEGLSVFGESQEELSQANEVSIDTLKIVDCPKLTELPYFSELRDLKIKRCKSLKVLPGTQSLEFLILIDNLVLEDLNEANSSFSKLLELKIVSCPKLQALPQVFAPQKVEIIGCELVTALPNPGCFRRLQHLAVDQSCHGGKLIGEIPDSSSLCSLVISNFSNATSFPKWPYLPSLRSLHIRHCKDLVSLCEEAAPFQGLTFLKLLSIQSCPSLATLPHGGLPKTLECLTISSCTSLEALGPEDVLTSLTSLTDLYIEYCPKIKRLPKEGVSPFLQHLVIQGCPLLMERCSKEGGGPDWPKIMHIPDLEVAPTNVRSSPDFTKSSMQASDSPGPGPKSPNKPRPSSAHWYSHLSCCSRGVDVRESTQSPRRLMLREEAE